jgi:hypothetical protein
VVPRQTAISTASLLLPGFQSCFSHVLFTERALSAPPYALAMQDNVSAQLAMQDNVSAQFVDAWQDVAATSGALVVYNRYIYILKLGLVKVNKQTSSFVPIFGHQFHSTFHSSSLLTARASS